ncbi:MAG: hypothetical protein JNK45_29385 [Myxococcales bacterium]|nr:hypothetical protein [Myxococcales bacterium]
MPAAPRAENGLDPATGITVAILVHVAAYFAIGWIDPPKPPKPEVIEFEVATLREPEPKPEPPPPEPKTPEPEPEEKPPEPEVPEPPDTPPKPPTKKPPKPAKAEPEPTNPNPNPDPAPAPKRFTLPPSALVPGAGGGVTVNPGTGGGTSGSGNGRDDGTGTKPGAGKGTTGTDPKPGGPAWAPKGDLFIAQQPRVVRVPEVECPAVTERQVSGTVVLLVQVQRDGKVRSARPTKKMGFGCDDIARKALMGAKFAPAVGTDGKTADYELRYEYVFELRD